MDAEELRKKVRLDVQWPCACIGSTDMHIQTSPGDEQSPDSMEDEEACGAAVTLALRLQLYDPRRWPIFGHSLIMITANQVVV